MSKVLAAVALTVLLFPVAGHAQAGRGAPPPRQAAGHGIDVPGWWARMDNPRAVIGSLKFTSEGSCFTPFLGQRRFSGIRSKPRLASTR